MLQSLLSALWLLTAVGYVVQRLGWVGLCGHVSPCLHWYPSPCFWQTCGGWLSASISSCIAARLLPPLPPWTVLDFSGDTGQHCLEVVQTCSIKSGHLMSCYHLYLALKVLKSSKKSKHHKALSICMDMASKWIRCRPRKAATSIYDAGCRSAAVTLRPALLPALLPVAAIAAIVAAFLWFFLVFYFKLWSVNNQIN